MGKCWHVDYKGHTIESEFAGFSTSLFVDGKLAQKGGAVSGFSKSELHTAIPDGQGAGEPVRCVFGGFWRVHADIWIGGAPMALAEETFLDLRELLPIVLAVCGAALVRDLAGSHPTRPVRLLSVLVAFLLWIAAGMALSHWRVGSRWRIRQRRPTEVISLGLSQTSPASAAP
ncbi:MAG: hypothetical protein ABSH50_08300 [Bryobacteraceae bacterium]